MEFADTKALVIGTGISGLSAVSLLERKGAQVILFDANEKLKCADVKAKLKADSQAQIVIGTLPEGLLDTVDLVIPSPGVPMDIPMMLEIRRREIPVWGEIELGYRCGQGSIAAITGTNGKTTTTALVGEHLPGRIQPLYGSAEPEPGAARHGGHAREQPAHGERRRVRRPASLPFRGGRH